MFNSREVKLLAILIGTDDWISGKILSDMLNVSNRTLQNVVADINRLLKSMSSSLTITSNNRLGYRLEGNIEQLCRIIAEEGFEQQDDTFQSANNILTVLLYEREYITLNDIAEKTFLAKSSVSTNMERVKRMIERTKGAYLNAHPRKGYKLEADEYIKRMLVVNALGNEISEVSRQYPEIVEGYEILDEIIGILVKVLVPESYIVEGKAFEAFSRYCAFSITREWNGYGLNQVGTTHKISPVSKKIASMITEELNYTFTNAELGCLDDRLEELNVIGTTKKDYPDVEKRIQKFLKDMSEETGLTVKTDAKRLKRFSEHLYRMYRRLDVGNYLRTLDPETIEKQYPVSLHLVRSCFRKTFKEKIPSNEERSMVPYLTSFLDFPPMKINMAIVSDLPVGEIYRYRSSLYDRFDSYLAHIQIYPTYLYEERFCGVDQETLFLTTEEGLVFQYRELTYVDIYQESYQNEMLSKLIQSKSNEQKQKVFQGYLDAFEKEVYRYANKATSWEEVLMKYLKKIDMDKTSCSILDNDTLLIIEHGLNKHAQIRIHTNQLPYQGKSINQILYFGIGCKEDTNLFGEYIKKVVNKRL